MRDKFFDHPAFESFKKFYFTTEPSKNELAQFFEWDHVRTAFDWYKSGWDAREADDK